MKTEKTAKITLPLRKLSRRRALCLSGAALAVIPGLLQGIPGARADANAAMELIETLTGGKTAQPGRITLQLPEIAENGNTVPLSFEVESPMTGENHVKAVHLVVDGNPRPEVASFRFTPLSGKAAASTRIRMAQTQNVIALAGMSDGSVYMAKREVKVTIGGCGG